MEMTCDLGSGGEGLVRSVQSSQHPTVWMWFFNWVHPLPTFYLALASEQDGRGQGMFSRATSDTQEPNPCYCTNTCHPVLPNTVALSNTLWLILSYTCPRKIKLLPHRSGAGCCVCLLQRSGVILSARSTRTSSVSKGWEIIS